MTIFAYCEVITTSLCGNLLEISRIISFIEYPTTVSFYSSVAVSIIVLSLLQLYDRM